MNINDLLKETAETTAKQDSILEQLWAEYTETSNAIGELTATVIVNGGPTAADSAEFKSLQSALAEKWQAIEAREKLVNELPDTPEAESMADPHKSAWHDMPSPGPGVKASAFITHGNEIEGDCRSAFEREYMQEPSFDVPDMTHLKANIGAGLTEAKIKRSKDLEIFKGRKVCVEGFEESGAPENTEGWHGTVEDVTAKTLSTQRQFLVKFGNGESYWYIADDLKFKD